MYIICILYILYTHTPIGLPFQVVFLLDVYVCSLCHKQYPRLFRVHTCYMLNVLQDKETK